MLNSIFHSIGLTNEHVNTYLLLVEGGPSQPSVISKKLHLPRATLYNLLYDLRDKDLVVQTMRKGTKVWQANSPKNIQTTIDSRINNLERQKEMLAAVIPGLEEKQKKDFVNPKFKFFEGSDSMRQALRDILFYRDM